MLYRKGNITTASGIIAHGVNTNGGFGSGVAGCIARKWPIVKMLYHISEMPTELGGVLFTYPEPNITLANCYTQKRYGRDGRVYAESSAIRRSLKKVIDKTIDSRKSDCINIPMIGCGYGGLNWNNDVEPIIRELESRSDIEFIVWYL